MNPPLQLESYFYTKINVQAAPPSTLPEEEKFEVNVNVNTTIKKKTHKENNKRWMVNLTINVSSPSEKPIPYKVDLEIVGFFEVVVDLEKQRMANLVHVTGASILYSAAREMVLMLTGRGPWAHWALPTISFMNMKQETSVTAKPDPPKNSETDASKKEDLRAAE